MLEVFPAHVKKTQLVDPFRTRPLSGGFLLRLYCADKRDNVRLHFQTTTSQPKRVQCPGDAQIPTLHGEEPDRGAAKGLTLELAAEALPTGQIS